MYQWLIICTGYRATMENLNVTVSNGLQIVLKEKNRQILADLTPNSLNATLTLSIWSIVMTEDFQRDFSKSSIILKVFSPVDSKTITTAWNISCKCLFNYTLCKHMRCKRSAFLYIFWGYKSICYMHSQFQYIFITSKEKLMKSYLDKAKRYEKTERTRQSEKYCLFWLWFERYMARSIWLLQYRWQVINSVKLIFYLWCFSICDFRRA